MPDVAGGLFDAPLRTTRRSGPPQLPIGWTHHQVLMPTRHGVDAVAGSVQLLGPGEPPDTDAPLAAAVRHWCGEDVGQLDVRPASAAELLREGGPVLRSGELDLHDPALVAQPGCPLVDVDDDTALLWTRATRLRDGEELTDGWVPYGQAVVRWLDRDPDQPLAHAMNMSGLGAARTMSGAIALACADLAAQDAVMTWWTHGTGERLPVVTPSTRLVEAWDHSPLELRLRELPSTTGVPAVLAVVLDPELDLAALAPAAGAGRSSRATAHALWQYTMAHDLLAADGDLSSASVPGLLAHRPDRGYLAAAGPGARRATDPLAAVQLGLDPALLVRLDERTAGGRGAATSHDETDGAVAVRVGGGRDLWVVDLTTAEVRAAGWHCVRVIATDLARTPVPAFPPDPGGRVADAARGLGWDTSTPEALPYPGW